MANPAEHEADCPVADNTISEMTTATPFQFSATVLGDRIQSLIGSELIQVNHILNRQLRSSHEYMGDILQHAGQFRGKQIRPVLLLLCQKAITGNANQTAQTLAAVVEMIHTATLVHDDVLDDASSRRHMATVHSAWNTETSVLLGDYLFSRAFRLAASTGDAGACELIGHATDLTCAGELHQIAAGQVRSKSERDYFRIIRGKTGQLFGLSCYLGVRATQASGTGHKQLQIAGLELGMAFQIADDVLDLTGKEDETGKDSGNDLANRRLTLPLIRALQLASATEQRQIESLLDTSSSELFAEQQQQLSAHPAVRKGVASADQTARRLIDRCFRRFMVLPKSPERQLLQSIAKFAVRRRS